MSNPDARQRDRMLNERLADQINLFWARRGNRADARIDRLRDARGHRSSRYFTIQSNLINGRPCPASAS